MEFMLSKLWYSDAYYFCACYIGISVLFFGIFVFIVGAHSLLCLWLSTYPDTMPFVCRDRMQQERNKQWQLELLLFKTKHIWASWDFVRIRKFLYNFHTSQVKWSLFYCSTRRRGSGLAGEKLGQGVASEVIKFCYSWVKMLWKRACAYSVISQLNFFCSDQSIPVLGFQEWQRKVGPDSILHQLI